VFFHEKRGRTSPILVIASFALPARTASAHPSSGIIVDQQGQVFFQDIVGGAIWKIDAQGKLTKYHDKLGGHWMAVDGNGSFSRADLKLVKRITPFGTKPTLLVAEGGTPIVVNPDGNFYLEYTNANGGPDEGWLPRVRRLGRDGTVTTLATISRQGR